MVLVLGIGGLPGAGKTTVIKGMHETPEFAGSMVLSSDELRKKMWGIDVHDRLPKEAYTGDFSGKVYAEMNQRLRQSIADGKNVILDTLFVTAEGRKINQDIAEESGADFIGIWLDAPLDTLVERVANRGKDASDAGIEQVRFFHSIFSPEEMTWPQIDTSAAPEIVTGQVCDIVRQEWGAKIDPPESEHSFTI